MELFHGSSHTSAINGVLNHFGNFAAAADVVESNFANVPRRYYSGRDFDIVDYYGNYIGSQSLETTLEDFIAHAAASVVRGFNADIKSPLRLVDCWTDDPIGSGGLGIFEASNLPPAKQDELRELFAPFESIIYPQHVHLLLDRDEILEILKGNDPVFLQEMDKRVQRSSLIGEDFRIAAGQEAVWVHLTGKLRQWALDNQFDAFVYSNTFEGTDDPNASDSYVTLESRQITETSTFIFDEEQYRDLVPHKFKRRLDEITSNSNGGLFTGVYWAGHNPAQFWKPQ